MLISRRQFKNELRLHHDFVMAGSAAFRREAEQVLRHLHKGALSGPEMYASQPTPGLTGAKKKRRSQTTGTPGAVGVCTARKGPPGSPHVVMTGGSGISSDLCFHLL